MLVRLSAGETFEPLPQTHLALELRKGTLAVQWPTGAEVLHAPYVCALPAYPLSAVFGFALFDIS